jgi:hypothetical protein
MTTNKERKVGQVLFKKVNLIKLPKLNFITYLHGLRQNDLSMKVRIKPNISAKN